MKVLWRHNLNLAVEPAERKGRRPKRPNQSQVPQVFRPSLTRPLIVQAWENHAQIDQLIALFPSCPLPVSRLVDQLLISAEAAEARFWRAQ